MIFKNQEKPKEVTAKEAKSLLDKGARLVDVREPKEFELKSIPGAEAIALGDLSNKFRDSDDLVIFSCRSGVRSLQAAQEMSQVYNKEFLSLKGGIIAWEEAGFDVDSSTGLSPDQLSRYSRQVLLPEVGLGGQEKLLNSRALIVGLGGLGSPVAYYLAAAGVSLGLVDSDLVDASNLQRQIIHTDARVGQSKVESAKKTLLDLNPTIGIDSYQTNLNKDNAYDLISQYDLVIDGSDNFFTRYLINQVTIELEKTFITASILGFSGQLTTLMPGQICYGCIYPEPPPPELAPACSTAGVIGAIAGVIGTMQASEAIKIILGIGENLVGKLVMFDALENDFYKLSVEKNPNCPHCQLKEFDLDQLEAMCQV